MHTSSDKIDLWMFSMRFSNFDVLSLLYCRGGHIAAFVVSFLSYHVDGGH